MPRLTEPLSRRAIGVLLGLAGAGLLAASGWIASGIRAEMQGWQRTTGTVVALKAVPSSGGRAPAQHAVVRFLAPTGAVELTSRSGSTGTPLTGGHRVGETLAVVYDPGNPSRARIDSVGEVWLWPVVVATPGLALLLASLAHFVFGPKRWAGRLREGSSPIS